MLGNKCYSNIFHLSIYYCDFIVDQKYSIFSKFYSNSCWYRSLPFDFENCPSDIQYIAWDKRDLWKYEKSGVFYGSSDIIQAKWGAFWNVGKVWNPGDFSKQWNIEKREVYEEIWKILQISS